MYLLELENVSVKLENCYGKVATLLHNLSFGIQRGEIIAVVGESGSGKTTLLRAITALTSPESNISIGGRVVFEGEDIVFADPQRLQHLREGPIRYIFQEPALAFNPLSRIRSQVQSLTGKDRYDEKIFISHLIALGLKEPEAALQSYPYQLSTGMLQRISIALALLNSPALILADEPTNAIDVIHRSAILQMLQQSCRDKNASVLLATHDLHIAERYADTVIVLYAGRIVEQSPAAVFFKQPLHPYSRFLLDKTPPENIDLFTAEDAVRQTQGNYSTQGCRFQSYCPIVQDICRKEEPELVPLTQNRKVRCPFSK